MIDLLLWLNEADYHVSSYIDSIDEEGKLLHASGSLSFGKSLGTFSMARRAGMDVEKLELHGYGRSVEVINMETVVFSEKGTMPQMKGSGSWDTILQRRGFAGAVNHFLHTLNQPEQCSIRADLVLETHHIIKKLTD